MSKPTLEMWDQVLTTYGDVLAQAEEFYLAKAKSKYQNHKASTADDQHTAVPVTRMSVISPPSELGFGYR
jgi:hypothetical protein